MTRPDTHPGGPASPNAVSGKPEPVPSLPLRTAADRGRRERVTLFEALQSAGIAVGMVVQSTAGHDYSRLAVVTALRPPFALVADGRYRPAAKPKKKRLSHLRPVAQADPEALADILALPDEGQRNSGIRRLIRRTAVPGSPEPAPAGTGPEMAGPGEGGPGTGP